MSLAPGESRHLNGWAPEKARDGPPSAANNYHLASADLAGVRAGSSGSRPPLLLMLAPTLEEHPYL